MEKKEPSISDKRRTKVNLITVLGVFLVLIGLTGPWFFFTLLDDDVGFFASFEMSPFILTVDVSSPSTELVNLESQLFFRLDATLIGLGCILGAVLCLVGGIIEQWKLSLVSGALVLFSTLSFGALLPGHLPQLSIGWGFSNSAFGSIILMASTGLEFLSDRVYSLLSFFIHKENKKK